MAKVELNPTAKTTSSTPDNTRLSAGMCFVIAPIGKPGSPERLHSDEVFDKLIKPAAEECGYDPKRADHFDAPGMIGLDMIESIDKSPLVIANLTGNNPNVYYELALRHTLEKPVIIIAPDYQDLPFDITGNRAIFFNLGDQQRIENTRLEIINQIKAIQVSADDYYNPISQALDVITAQDDAQFTLRDIRKALSQIPDLNPKDIVKHLVNVQRNLRGQGILTRRELRELMSNKRILDILRDLYRTELLRPIDGPLDPTAIATWGAFLYVSAQIDDDEQLQEAIRQVTEDLRNSGEYIRIHGDLVIHVAWYGADTRVVDITRILQGKVDNNRLKIKVNHHAFGIKDPAYGERKDLVINYSYRGQKFPERTFGETDTIDLP